MIRDWLKYLLKSWPPKFETIIIKEIAFGSTRVNTIKTQDKLKQMLNKYKNIFSINLGLLKNFKAKFYIKDLSKP